MVGKSVKRGAPFIFTGPRIFVGGVQAQSGSFNFSRMIIQTLVDLVITSGCAFPVSMVIK